MDQQSFFRDYDMIGETESNEIFFSLPIGMHFYITKHINRLNLKKKYIHKQINTILLAEYSKIIFNCSNNTISYFGMIVNCDLHFNVECNLSINLWLHSSGTM